MGTWSVDAFGNDDAADWAFELEESEDLAPIEQAIATVLEAGDEYIEAPDAAVALAAIEALARLMGKPGERTAYTENVDKWVASADVEPSADLVDQALAAIARILGDNSELRELWEESEDFDAWIASVSELRDRLGT